MMKLGFGLMRLPLTEEGDAKSIDQELLNKMVDYYLKQGFDYFDTGYPYHQGMSEIAAKKALAERHARDKFTIADKMPTWMVKGTADYQRLFDEQLERCGVTYFDYYMLHALSARAYENTLTYGGFEFMEKLKTEGGARHIGFSYHDKAELLDKILTEHPEMEFVQLQINYIDWDNESVQSRKCYEVALKHGKRIIVMEPVKGGVLANVPEEAEKLFKAYQNEKSPASWAIRFTASLENIMVVLSGMSTFEQLVDNVGYMRDFKPLDSEEREIVKKVTEIIDKNIAIPCTYCEYCVEDCPQKISIPQYFALYNDQKRFGLNPYQIASYENLTGEFGKPADCIACRRCEEHCPQHLEIVECLKEVSNIFERAS
jgi:predicted aldo/keto reductase-like oxidoreductase